MPCKVKHHEGASVSSTDKRTAAKTHSCSGYISSNQAEDEGFKPPIRGKRIPDFESSAFGHSANLPEMLCKSNEKR